MQQRLIMTAAAVSGVLAIALTGCSASGGMTGMRPPSSTAHAGESTPASSPHTVADPSGPVPGAGTVGAETDVRTPDGSLALHLRVVATGNDGWVVQTSDYRSTKPGQYALFLRQFDEQVGDTIEDGVSFGYDNWGSPGTDNADGPPAQISLMTAGVDPGFLRDAVITSMGDEGFRVLAVAPLTWTLPDRYPSLRIEDSGASVGANGTVEMQDGVPRWYHVAAGDTLEAITKRFGVSVAELDYLDARQLRDFSAGAPLRSGTQLNLDRTKR